MADITVSPVDGSEAMHLPTLDSSVGFAEGYISYPELVDMTHDVVTRLEKLEIAMASKDGKCDLTRQITRPEMESMVRAAIGSGPPDFGIGKRYIWSFLRQNYGLRETIHYQKKMNIVLRCMVDDGEICFDSKNQLFRSVSKN